MQLHPIYIGIFTLLNIQNLVAQTISTENYANGAPKIRYHIRKNDTFCIEHLHENGFHQATFWHDSTHYFHPNQKIAKKTYSENQILPAWLWIASNKNDAETFDDLHAITASTFYPDGKLQEKVIWEHDDLVTQMIYLPNGQLYQTFKYDKLNNHIFNYFEIKATETLHFKTDTTAKIQERFGYRNGQLVHHEIYRWEAEKEPRLFELKKLILMDGNKVDFAWQADTAKWKLYRSQESNLYGFRNGQGDWVVPPKYDFATRFNIAYFIVNENGKYGVLNEYGKVIIPIEWDFLESFDLNHRPSYDLLPPTKQAPTPIFPYAALKPDRAAQLCFRKGNLYGVIDWRGNVILQPVYEEIRQCYNDLYEVKMNHYWGIVDKSGQIIVSPQYKAVDFTPFKDLFITTDTTAYPADAAHPEERLRFGLVNAQNKTLLTPNFALIQVEKTSERCFQTYSFQKEDELSLFHAEKGWLLDTNLRCHVEPRWLPTRYKLLFQADSAQPKRYGLFDGIATKMLLPFDYESITYFTKKIYNSKLPYQSPEEVYRKEVFLHCVKQGKHGVFDPQRRKWLIPLRYDAIRRLGESGYLVSKHGKQKKVAP
jgi:WG containing repeat